MILIVCFQLMAMPIIDPNQIKHNRVMDFYSLKSMSVLTIFYYLIVNKFLATVSFEKGDMSVGSVLKDRSDVTSSIV